MGLASRIAKASAAVGGRLKADSRNNEQKYDYISADKILSVCGQALAEQEVTVIPAIAAEVVDVVDRGNGKYRYDAAVTFHMIVADDEKEITAMWVGRGSDYTVPDKALYKAITSGHKYFLMKLLNIGEGNEDGEHEPAEESPRQQPQRQTQQPPAVEMASKTQLVKLNALGTQLYGKEWTDDKRHALVAWKTKNRTQSSKELTADEADSLITGLQKKINEAAAEVQTAPQEQPADNPFEPEPVTA